MTPDTPPLPDPLQRPAVELSPADIAERLQARFGQRIIATHAVDKHPRVHINAEDWPEVAAFLHDEADLRFDWLACLGGIDYPVEGLMAVAVDLLSTTHRHLFAIKIFTSRSSPSVPSASRIWPAAGWHEREAYDLFGINFPGHADLRRILLDDDWVGHPLRKDYEFPREVHGIPGSVELDWQQKPEKKKPGG